MNSGMMWALLFVGCLFQPGDGGKARQYRGPSRQPISTKQPKLPGGTQDTLAKAFPGPFLRDFQPPFPTNSWWQGFTVINDQNNGAAGPFPFNTLTENDGFQFGLAYERKLGEGKVDVPVSLDLSISIAKLPVNINNRKATDWDTQTLSLQYIATDGSTMDTTLVPGSPYLTFKFNKAQVILKNVEKKSNITFKWDTAGRKGRVTTPAGVYLLYVIDGTLNQFIEAANTLTFAALQFTGTIRLARLIDTKQEAILDTYRTTYATALTMAYDVQGDVGTTTYTWDVVGDSNKLLIMCWPHHRKVLVQPNFVDIEYMNIKGRMKGVLGNQWIQKFNLPPVQYKSNLQPHPSCLEELKKILDYEVKHLQVLPAGNVYFWASAISRYATMATIADHLGLIELRNRAVEITKASFDQWVDPAFKPRISYEPKWGGVVHRGDNNNLYYNDHHFCAGYHLYAASVIGKFDPAWLSSRLEYFTQFARDVGNPSPDDPYFTVARNMDFFTGHSWASGIEGGAGERNQESSSEAVNAYYGLMLFGDATGNTELVKWARLLYAIEIIGAQTYWHLYPNSTDPENPYPEIEFRKIITVGNIYPNGATRALHYSKGTTKIQVASIQTVPVTPIANRLYDQEWSKEVVPFCFKELKDPSESDKWKSVIYAAYATVNPKQAYTYSLDLTYWGDGNSASNQLYFISTQPPVGGGNICAPAISQTPEGVFFIQDVQTGLYVGTSDKRLRANIKSTLIATPVELAFVPGGGSIKSLWTNLFVNGAPEGQGLHPTKAVVESGEIFRWKPVQIGYELRAMSNKKVVQVDATGFLLNTGGASRKFRVVKTTILPIPVIPPKGKLQSVQSNLFVVSTTKAPTLLANATQNAGGTTFVFEKVAGTDLYVIWNSEDAATRRGVTANKAGTSNLVANKDKVGYGEWFRFILDNGQFIIVHDYSGLAVVVDENQKLINNAVEVGTRARFNIVQ